MSNAIKRWSTCWDSVKHLLKAPTGDDVIDVVIDIFQSAEILDSRVAGKLRRLIAEMQARYHPTPYHNFVHATHVLVGTYILLENSLIKWTRVEKAALLYTALAHDVQHQGVPNIQLVKENSPLAQKFNNISVAENNSFEIAMALLVGTEGQEPLDIFEDFKAEEKDLFRSLCRSILLCTDIADRESTQRLYASISNMLENTTSKSDEHAFDITNQNYRCNILCLCMKLADIGAPIQELSTALCWAQLFFNECSAAHASGRGAAIGKLVLSISSKC